MIEPQAIIIPVVTSLTSKFKNTRNNCQSKFKEYYNPCFVVLIKYFVSCMLESEKQEKDEIFSSRHGLLYLTNNGGRRDYKQDL